RMLEVTHPSSEYIDIPETEPLRLDCDKLLAPIRIAYKTYGTLNANKSNAVLICHALTMDQYVASEHPVTRKPGWWEAMVGPGKPVRPRSFVRDPPKHPRRLQGTAGPRQHQSRHRPPLGARLSRHHHWRHGRRAGTPDRPARHRSAV